MSLTLNQFAATISVNNGEAALVSGSASATWTTLYTAGSSGSLVRAIGMTFNSGSTANVWLGYLPSGSATTYPIGSSAITGTTTLLAPTNMLTKINVPFGVIDNQGNVILHLAPSDALQVMCSTALSSGSLTVTAQGENF